MDNPTFATATVTEVAANGLKLKFPGEETGGAKVYPCNAGCSFEVGDRVVVYPDSGTYIVMFPLGAPGSKIQNGIPPSDGVLWHVPMVSGYADRHIIWGFPHPQAIYDTYDASLATVYSSGSGVICGRNGGLLGFFGKGPFTQQAVADNATVATLIATLKTIGLIR